MKKPIFIVLLMFCFGLMMAQSTVNGKVTDRNGDPLISVNILVKGTTVGTITDLDGNYSITVPEGSNTLVVSYIGYVTQEVNVDGADRVDVTMENDDQMLADIVVTALGIERDEKSLGYSVQEIGGLDLVQTQSTNIVSNLAGNIAGVQVIGSAGSSVGGSAKIRIRGVNGLEGDDPLFVVDGTPISNDNFSGTTAGSDFGNLASDINPEDVEKISVLKGPAATALYGNRAKNGVVLITLKKGKGAKGVGVTASTSLTFDQVYILPEYQNEYAGGYSQDFITVTDPVDGQDYKVLNYSADESWGPRMDGTTYRPWWSWFPGEDYGKTIPLEGNENNVRDFFETGQTNQNSFSVQGGDGSASFRLSYANVNQTGVFPNSRFDKNSIGLFGGYEITPKLQVNANINVLANKGRARPEFGYNGKNPATSFNQWFQRQIDMDQLRNYITDEGVMRSWNINAYNDLTPLYWDNPFYIQYRSYNTDSRSRYFGNVSLNYDLTDDLSIKGTIHRDDFTQRIEYRNGSESLDPDLYREFVANFREDNYELLLTYGKNLSEDLSLDVNLGGNSRINSKHNTDASTVGGLSIPNLFTLKASNDRPEIESYIENKKVNSIFGSANLGFKNFLYLGGTVRNDWSSALPVDNNSYLYPSVSASLVFSELMNDGLLSYGKLRASWAQVGSDLEAYQIVPTYGIGTPYGSSASFNESNTIIDPNLKTFTFYIL